MKPAPGGYAHYFLAVPASSATGQTVFDTRLVNVTAGLRIAFRTRFNIPGRVEFEHGITRMTRASAINRLVGIPLTLEFRFLRQPAGADRGIRLSAGTCDTLRGGAWLVPEHGEDTLSTCRPYLLRFD